MTNLDASLALSQRLDIEVSKERLSNYFTTTVEGTVSVSKPSSLEELMEILSENQRERIPFIPYAPGFEYIFQEVDSEFSMIVDVSNLDRIVDVDEDSRVASIEPGVTFESLQNAVGKKGLRVLTSVEVPKSSSVLWTYTELSPLYSWPRYGTEPVLTMNVLLPNGKLVKTGAGALPNSGKPYSPIGPPFTLLGRMWYGSQMTLGLPVRGYIKLKTAHESNIVRFFKFDDFLSLSKFLAALKRLRIGEEILAVTPLELGLILSDKADKIKTTSYPNWLLILVMRGYEEEVAYQKRDLLQEARKLGVKVLDEIEGQKNSAAKILKEIQSPTWMSRARTYQGGRFSISFIAEDKKIPDLIQLVSHLDNFSSFVLPVDAGRSHCNFAFHSRSEGRKQSIPDELKKIVPELIEHGAFFSRPFGFLSEMVYARNKPYHKLLKQFKQDLDPNNLLCRGRLGI
ncbi:MAG: FAD-binding oxidoreductase [Thaumarchaeota archaeon]|nr:FAD-binding oxidoreductase [Nitrososphaerota archaeon]